MFLPRRSTSVLNSDGFRFATGLPAAATACFLIAEALAVPTRVEAEVFEHLEVFFDGLIQRGEIIADHQCARTSHENHTLCVAKIHGAAAGDHDLPPGQNETEARDGFEDFHYRQRRILLERRAGNRIENVDGHDIRADGFHFKREVAAVFARLTHADNAAGTNLDARLFKVADGFE